MNFYYLCNVKRYIIIYTLLLLPVLSYAQTVVGDTSAVDTAIISQFEQLLDDQPVDSSDIAGMTMLENHAPVDAAYLAELEALMIQHEKRQQAKKIVGNYEKFLMRRMMRYNTDGWSMLFRGALLTKTEKGYRDNAPLFEDKSKDWFDYGLAALPAAATYLGKIFGAESRSTTKRLVISNAIAFGLTAGLSSGLKGIVSERRPDGTDDQSMPSRHTAMAFAAATILDREYGYKSPWISVGGYAAATATQFMRLHNNAHWINDLYIGAGIGVVSTNFAYFITDKILGAAGINTRPKVGLGDIRSAMNFELRPTSFTLVSGIESGHVGNYHGEATYSAGMEYSYFFDSHLAAEALCRMSTTKINEYCDNLLLYHADASMKYSYPLLPGLRLSARAIAGGRFSAGIAEIDGNAFELGGGCSFDYLGNDRYAFGVSFDYYHAFSDLMKNRYLVGMTWKIMVD